MPRVAMELLHARLCSPWVAAAMQFGGHRTDFDRAAQGLELSVSCDAAIKALTDAGVDLPRKALNRRSVATGGRPTSRRASHFSVRSLQGRTPSGSLPRAHVPGREAAWAEADNRCALLCIEARGE